MPRKSLAWRTLPLLFVLGSAYLVLENEFGNPFQWDTPLIRVQLWNGFRQPLPGVTGGNIPRITLIEALNRWARESSSSISVTDGSLSRTAKDGVNVVTMTSDGNNSSEVSGRLAVTLLWSQAVGQVDKIVEADVLFNPNPTEPWSTRELDNTLSILDVAIHEFGHLLGMQHGISRSSRMFFQGGSFSFGLSQLTWNDVAGVNRLFPLPGLERITGSIAGRVSRSGQSVFGAFVVAVDSHGVIMASSISFLNGNYRIQNLPPGDYSIYAEPLDGPTRPSNISGGIFSSSSLDTDFRPTFFQNSPDARIPVRMGITTSGIDIAVQSGQTPLDPEFVGAAPDPFGGIRVASTATRAHQGTDTNIVVAGKGVGQLNDSDGVQILGDRLASGRISATRNHPGGTVFKFYPIHVPSDAPIGPYAMFLQGAGDIGVVTGGLEIYSPFRFQQSFAQFAHLPGSVSSRIFVINTNLEETVQTSLEVLAADGQLVGNEFAIVSSDQSLSRSTRLNPGGSSVFATSGSRELRGSARAQGERWPTAATLLIDSDFGTTGMGPGPELHAFLIPVDLTGRGLSKNTGIAISNLDQREAQILIQLHDSGGLATGEQILTLPGGGQMARFVDEILSVPFDGNGSFQGTIVVTSNRLVTAAAIRTEPAVFTTFPVIPNGVDSRRVFAQFAHGKGLSSELIVVNPSTKLTAGQVRIRVRNSSGQATPVTLNGVFYPSGELTISVPPRGMRSLRTSQTDLVGWLEFESELPVGGIVLFSSSDQGTAGVGQSPISTRLVVPLDRDLSQATDMGVALVNTDSGTNSVRLQVRDQDGAPIGSLVTLQLQGNQHLAQFINQQDLDFGLPDQFTGSLWVESSLPVAVTAIRQSPGVLTTFPASDRLLALVPALEPLQ